MKKKSAFHAQQYFYRKRFQKKRKKKKKKKKKKTKKKEGVWLPYHLLLRCYHYRKTRLIIHVYVFLVLLGRTLIGFHCLLILLVFIVNLSCFFKLHLFFLVYVLQVFFFFFLVCFCLICIGLFLFVFSFVMSISNSIIKQGQKYMFRLWHY